MTEPTPPIQAQRLDLFHLMPDDRLAVVAVDSGGRGTVFLLTRRLTRLFAGKLVQILMTSSPEIGRASAEHRETVLLFEHVAATTAQAPGPAGAGTAVPQPPAAPTGLSTPVLTTRIDFDAAAGGLVIRLIAEGGPEVAFTLTRPQVHHLLGIVAAKAREAEWDLGELSWFDRTAQVMLPGSAMAS